MTSVVRQKRATYMDWTVPTRSHILSHLTLFSQSFLRDESKPFMFQDSACNLAFYTDTSSYGDARLFFKRRGPSYPELEVIVFASWRSSNFVLHSASPERCKISSGCGYAEIWKHEAGKLMGSSPTFEIIIHTNISKRDVCIQTASYLNADGSVESLFKDFSELLDSGLNFDAEIKCEDGSIKAHKNVLCARSEVFKAMLESDMVEGRTGVVEVEDTDINNIQDFVRYLYTGTLPELTFDKAKALYKLGDKYLVRSLVIRSSEYLIDNLTSENACQTLVLADERLDKKLKDEAIAYILDKKIYLQDELWLPLRRQCLELANEVYELWQECSGSEKRPVVTSENGMPNFKMTVLKKHK